MTRRPAAEPANLSPILYTVTFSEPVTGFTGSDISFAGSTVGGTLVAAVTGSGADYMVSVAGMSGVGAVVASIGAGAASDLVGNANFASTSIDNSVSFSSNVGTSGNDMLAASNAGAQSLDGLAGDDTLVDKAAAPISSTAATATIKSICRAAGRRPPPAVTATISFNGTGNGELFPRRLERQRQPLRHRQRQ